MKTPKEIQSRIILSALHLPAGLTLCIVAREPVSDLSEPHHL